MEGKGISVLPLVRACSLSGDFTNQYSTLLRIAYFVGSNERIASAIEIPRSPNRDLFKSW